MLLAGALAYYLLLSFVPLVILMWIALSKFVDQQALLATMGERLVAGRDFTWTDVYNKRPVAMVSENLAREVWRTPQEALGKQVESVAKPEFASHSVLSGAYKASTPVTVHPRAARRSAWVPCPQPTSRTLVPGST